MEPKKKGNEVTISLRNTIAKENNRDSITTTQKIGRKVRKKGLATRRKKALAVMINKASRKRKAIDTIDTGDSEVLGPRTRGRKNIRFSQEVDL
jgi:hypothetical protein